MTHPPDASAPPLVLFDGHCGFCRAGAAFIAERQRPGAVRFVALASDEGKAALVAYGFPVDFDRSMVLIENDQAYTDSAAVWRLAVHMRWPWRAFAVGRLVPRPVRDAMYRWVARNRGKLPGGGACAIDPRHGPL